MMTALRPSRQTDRIGFPWDLTEWVRDDTLAEWIRTEIQSLDWDNPLLGEYLRTHPNSHPRLLLTLLLHAYATGIYASEDIVEQCYSNPVFRSICGSEPPTSAVIVNFRRENRGLLKWGLQQILKRALREKYSLGDGPLPPGLRPHVVDAALTRLDLARHLDRSAQAA
jgi:hypothetical protein